MAVTTLKPTTPFEPSLVLRTPFGVFGRYRTIIELALDLENYGFSINRVVSNTLTHGDFRRPDEALNMGYQSREAGLSLRWCTGEPVDLAPGSSCWAELSEWYRSQRGKSWRSKRRHRAMHHRRRNTVCRIQRYGTATVAEELEPPVRNWKASILAPYEDDEGRRVPKCWKDQSKCRKQWQRKLAK